MRVVRNILFRDSCLPVSIDRALLREIGSERLFEKPPFRPWLDSIAPELQVASIHIETVDMFGSKVGFIKAQARVMRPDGSEVPGIVFLRGGSVAVLPIVITRSGKRFTFLCEQIRLPAGGTILECPAGMLDASSNFTGVAAREIQEETGLTFSSDQMIDLVDLVSDDYACVHSPLLGRSALWVSPGASDETMRFFTAVVRDVDDSVIEHLLESTHGAANENEHISLHRTWLHPTEIGRRLLSRTRDMKSFTAGMLLQLAISDGLLKL